MPKADFDTHAPDYDEHFSYTLSGRIYRERVQDYLKQILPSHPAQILELNCGTGEDAFFLSALGHRVLAIDISGEMIRMAEEKAGSLLNSHGPEFKNLDMREISSSAGNFDLVFSNFGGLNCLSPADLKEVLRKIAELLNPGGRLVLVVMPQYCTWEIVYFFLKMQWKKMFRRKSSQAVKVVIDGATVNTWYYQPSAILKMLPDFELKKMLPIGIALPPPSFNPLLENHPGRLKFFKSWEYRLSSFSFLSGIADHYLIDLRKA